MTTVMKSQVDLVLWCVWLFENSNKKELFAAVLGKDPNDKYEQAYLNDKVNRYGRDFGEFYTWLDNEYKATFIKMAIEKYG